MTMTQNAGAEDTALRDKLNPYATFLGGGDPVDSMRESPAALAQLIAGASDDAVR